MKLIKREKYLKKSQNKVKYLTVVENLYAHSFYREIWKLAVGLDYVAKGEMVEESIAANIALTFICDLYALFFVTYYAYCEVRSYYFDKFYLRALQ